MKRVVLLLILLSTLACGSAATTAAPANTEKSETEAPTEGSEITEEASAEPSATVGLAFHAIGEAVAIEDVIVTMNSAAIEGEKLKANFLIENQRQEDFHSSQLITFTAKDDEGNQLEHSIFDCGTSSLDGSILPGDKLRGDICWTITTGNTFKIYFDAGASTAVWQVER